MSAFVHTFTKLQRFMALCHEMTDGELAAATEWLIEGELPRRAAQEEKKNVRRVKRAGAKLR